MMNKDDFQQEIDAAVANAIAGVCVKHGRMPGPFIGIARWLDTEGGGITMIFPEDQVIFDSISLTHYLDMMITNAAANSIQYGEEDYDM